MFVRASSLIANNNHQKRHGFLGWVYICRRESINNPFVKTIENINETKAQITYTNSFTNLIDLSLVKAFVSRGGFEHLLGQRP